MAERRVASKGGAELLVQLEKKGFRASRIVPSMQFQEGDKGDAPLALALTDGGDELALGLDEGAWLRLAAVRHGLHGYRFYHQSWLGSGCVAASADVSGICCLARDAEGLETLVAALLGEIVTKAGGSPRILDMSSALPLGAPVHRDLTDLLHAKSFVSEPETAAWLFQRWKGAEMAHWVLASREANDRLRVWLGGDATVLPETYRMWLESGRQWGEGTAQAAFAKQAEVIGAFREIFRRFDAIAIPVEEDAQFVDGVPAWGRLNSPVDLAQLPARLVPLAKGRSIMLVYPNIERGFLFR